MSDWKDIATLVATLLAVPGVVFAALKTWSEIKKAIEQREKENLLKRAEFTLSQHHRLFDNSSLCAILDLLDGDDPRLAGPEMFESKRRFLVFFEEIALLVNSEYLSKGVAYYMFGYYAIKANAGSNFRAGMNYSPAHWGLFMAFAERAHAYLSSTDPESFKSLKL